MNNYLICATPRSGSNLLCEILSSLGFAGKAGEHLWNAPHEPPVSLRERWPQVLRAGTGENGVFGMKLMWYQTEQLQRELPDVLGMPDEPLTRVLAATLATPKYIYLKRRDRLRQAVSLVRAIQTAQWRSMDSATGKPRYDTGAITREMRFLEDDETHWENFFDRNAVSPYRLTYEDLYVDPQGTVDALLIFLGYKDRVTVSLDSTQHRRQADDVTETWIHRYEKDQKVPRPR